MGSLDENNKVVDGIPDRTIGRLLLDLSKAKGNNIVRCMSQDTRVPCMPLTSLQTLILDCCHAAGINRGRGQPGSNDLGEARQVKMRPRNVSSVQNLSPTCDVDIFQSDVTPDSRWDSHVLLAACKRTQSAWEIEKSGVFTEALLKGLRCAPSVGVLTYASLMQHLEMPTDIT